MNRLDLLQDYRRLQHAEQAPVRTAINIVFLATVGVVAYIVYASYIMLGLSEIELAVMQQEEDLSAKRQGMEVIQADNEALLVKVESAQARLDLREQTMQEQATAAAVEKSEIGGVLQALDESMPASLSITHIRFQGATSTIEGICPSATEAVALLNDLRKRNIGTELLNLKTRKREGEDTLYFTIACTPRATTEGTQ